MRNNNELIAIFMGWVIDNSFPDKNHVYRFGGRVETINTFKFDTSWEWLMEVVAKIEEKHRVTIERSGILIEITDSPFNWIEIGTLRRTKREAVYLGVVEYIKWYNEHASK